MTKLGHRAVKSPTRGPQLTSGRNLLYDPGSLPPKRELLPTCHTPCPSASRSCCLLSLHPASLYLSFHPVPPLQLLLPGWPSLSLTLRDTFWPYHSFCSLWYGSYIQVFIEHLHCVRLSFNSSRQTGRTAVTDERMCLYGSDQGVRTSVSTGLFVDGHLIGPGFCFPAAKIDRTIILRFHSVTQNRLYLKTIFAFLQIQI